MCGWCLAYCTGVILNTVQESAMPDSKENKQADAGSRRFRRRHFLCGALLCNFLSTEHEGLSTHVQREWSAEPFMPSILSLRIFCTAVLSRCKFSPPTVLLLLLLFLTFSALVANPKKTTLHGGQSRSWSAVQGKKKKKKSLAAHPPPPPPRAAVCCVFFPLILDIKFVGRTSRGHTGGRSHRISHPPFCGACLNFSREKDSAIPFPRRP